MANDELDNKEKPGMPETVTVSRSTALMLFDIAENVLDKEGLGKGGWPELEKAVDEVGPHVYKDYESIFFDD